MLIYPYVKTPRLPLILAVVLAIPSFGFTTPLPQPSQAEIDAIMQQSILQLINAYRTKHHLRPLRLNSKASQEATRHSQAMANKSIPFGHTQFKDRMKRLCTALGSCRGSAENVAYYQLNAERLVDAWIASPGHRRNIQGHYNVTGIGIAHGKAGWGYFTQIFMLTNNKEFA